MKVGNLKIPDEIVTLLRCRKWPVNHIEAIRQNLESQVSPETIRNFISDENWLFLYPPLFRTMQRLIELDRKHWSDESLALWDIDPALTIIIADFGIGSDTLMALDYRFDIYSPRVIRLQWRLPEQKNQWIVVSESFDLLSKKLNLTNGKKWK